MIGKLENQSNSRVEIRCKRLVRLVVAVAFHVGPSVAWLRETEKVPRNEMKQARLAACAYAVPLRGRRWLLLLSLLLCFGVGVGASFNASSRADAATTVVVVIEATIMAITTTINLTKQKKEQARREETRREQAYSAGSLFLLRSSLLSRNKLPFLFLVLSSKLTIEGESEKELRQRDCHDVVT